MSAKATKPERVIDKKEFRLVLTYIDSSYYDDGSRYAHYQMIFKNKRDYIIKLAHLIGAKCIELISPVTHEKGFFTITNIRAETIVTKITEYDL